MADKNTYPGREAKKGLFCALVFGTQVTDLINFHRQSNDLAKVELAKANEELEELSGTEDRDQYRAASSRVGFYSRYPSYLRTNTFLMLFSLIEELLASGYEILTEAPIVTQGNGIARFKCPYSQLKLDLGSTAQWEFLTKCQTVRNVLLHANGRIALCDRPDDVREILDSARWSAFFGVREPLIRIERGGESKSQFLDVKAAGVNELFHTYQDLEEFILAPEEEQPTSECS